ncbi:DUF4652 domain-containing protein [Sporosarcina luteola]|uniref:DUF4652 domain-containing protein n=1 Tax=Sporosarcina luteola TaxID=582850 RepID=UPI0020413268|nr:DUF4652 domain-containing protein [Sporosarcina luteola]MCM3709611.1 DUF4652 domain-containing protein [Sporosarcina luteola]
MTNYRMKRLQNTVENKKRIMLNTRQKITEPMKKSINWTYFSTSMAAAVFCIVGAVLLWDSIENPQVINNSTMFVEETKAEIMINESEVELMVIDIASESITIEDRETIGFIADWLNEVSSKPQQKLEDNSPVYYNIYIQNKGYYPSGAISITSDKLIIGENFNEISTQQYETISSLISEVQNREYDRVSNELFEIKVGANYDIANANSHSGWKTSPDGLQRATIDGKGENAIEEGEALLIIENLKTNKSTIYKLKDNIDAQNTPKYVEWIDENRLFVIVGFAHGTVTKGGRLYEMNVEDNTVIPVFEDLTDKEEIMSIKANDDGTFTYEKHVYIDDVFSEGYVEEGTIPFPPDK